jgi:hypothetical protein
VGFSAGGYGQGVNCVAVGVNAGSTGQGTGGVAAGVDAGRTNQGRNGIAVGVNAGNSNQAFRAIAIGEAAGQVLQGTGAIAIGQAAGQTGQAAGSIVLNAGGSWSADTTYTTDAGFFVRPVRGLAASTAMYYNPTTYEISYLASSASVKNSIEDLVANTSVIDNLKPKTYKYNSEPDAGTQIGYIAEEVSKLHHSFATYDVPGGKPVAIDYNVIVVFLAEEVKKLKVRVEQQQQEIDALKTQAAA